MYSMQTDTPPVLCLLRSSSRRSRSGLHLYPGLLPLAFALLGAARAGRSPSRGLRIRNMPTASSDVWYQHLLFRLVYTTLLFLRSRRPSVFLLENLTVRQNDDIAPDYRRNNWFLLSSHHACYGTLGCLIDVELDYEYSVCI